MKKKYIMPSMESLQMTGDESLLVTSNLDVGGETDHFDSRTFVSYDDEDKDNGEY